MIRVLAAALLCLPFVASAQTVMLSSSRPVLLFQSIAVVGNGADTTEDTLYTIAIPNQLANVGDVIHVVARGTLAASTDTKSVRLKLVGQTACSFNSTLVGQTTWLLEAWVMKTGSSTQSNICLSTNAANNVVNAQTATVAADGATLAVSLTGQNTTTSTLNSIQAQQMMVWYIPGT